MQHCPYSCYCVWRLLAFFICWKLHMEHL
uniref:Uncharacterized protein n=1 Tax=Rhizophora mucronata TaxID=61149 RepID=A0A2P2Q7J1_RHIMU